MAGPVGGNRINPLINVEINQAGLVDVQNTRGGRFENLRRGGDNPPTVGNRAGEPKAGFLTRIKEGLAGFKAKLGEIRQNLSEKIGNLQTRFQEWKTENKAANTEKNIARLERQDVKLAGGESNVTLGTRPDPLDLEKGILPEDAKRVPQSRMNDILKPFQGEIGKTASATRINEQATKKEIAGISTALTSIINEIKQREGGTDSYIENRDQAILDLALKGSNKELQSLDRSFLREVAGVLRDQGRTEKADFLDKLSDVIDGLSDPEFAKANFKDLAKEAMQARNEGTFLRQTSEKEVASVAKLMTAMGIEKVRPQATNLLNVLTQGEKFENLDLQLKELNVKTLNHLGKIGEPDKKDVQPDMQTMTEIGNDIGQLSLDLAKGLKGIDVPQGVKTELTDLANEIWNRVGAQENGLTETEAKAFVFKLYADQLMLKTISPELSVASLDRETGSPTKSLAVTNFQRVANDAGGSMGNALSEVLTPYDQGIKQAITDFFVSIGMPTEKPAIN